MTYSVVFSRRAKKFIDNSKKLRDKELKRD
jgi:hypothetical protein